MTPTPEQVEAALKCVDTGCGELDHTNGCAKTLAAALRAAQETIALQVGLCDSANRVRWDMLERAEKAERRVKDLINKSEYLKSDGERLESERDRAIRERDAAAGMCDAAMAELKEAKAKLATMAAAFSRLVRGMVPFRGSITTFPIPGIKSRVRVNEGFYTSPNELAMACEALPPIAPAPSPANTNTTEGE